MEDWTEDDWMEWVEQTYEALDAKDVDSFVAQLTPGATLRFGNGEPLAGRVAIRDAYQEFFDAIGMPLHEATYLNDWVDPHPLGAGLYWGLKFKDAKGDAWKLDLWGWDPFDFAVRQARDDSLRVDLKTCDRDLILRLKAEARGRDNYYGVRVTSFDIYQFAIAKAGDSLSALEMWKKQQ